MARELNNLLSLSVDWSALKKTDLERVHDVLIDNLTFPRALSLHAESFRSRLASMPIVQLLHERAQIIKADYQRQTLLQQKLKKNPTIPLDPKGIQPLGSQEKQKRIQPSYIS